MNQPLTISTAGVTLAPALNRDTLSKDAWVLLKQSERNQLKQMGDVNITLSNITHMDSAGLAWLLNLKRDAIQANVTISFSAAPDNVRHLAALSGVEHLFLN